MRNLSLTTDFQEAKGQLDGIIAETREQRIRFTHTKMYHVRTRFVKSHITSGYYGLLNGSRVSVEKYSTFPLICIKSLPDIVHTLPGL